MQIANAFIQYCTTHWGLLGSSLPNRMGGEQTGWYVWVQIVEDKREPVGGWMLVLLCELFHCWHRKWSLWHAPVCTWQKKKKSISTVFILFILKSSLRHFGLLEPTIKDTLSGANNHNPQPQVSMLFETSLTINHVKQLLAYVSFSPLSLSLNNVAPG